MLALISGQILTAENFLNGLRWPSENAAMAWVLNPGLTQQRSKSESASGAVFSRSDDSGVFEVGIVERYSVGVEE